MTKFSERKKKWGEEMVFKSLSLPENIIEKLKLLRELYKDSYGRNVSYGEIFERLFSSMGLGNVDPAVYSNFVAALKSREEFDEVVTRSTKKIVDEIEARAAANGTTFLEEHDKVQKEVIEKMEAQKEAYEKMTDEEKCLRIINEWEDARKPSSPDWTGEWYVHPDGRMYATLKGRYGKSDYARVDELVKCKDSPFASEQEMLAAGFRRMKK